MSALGAVRGTASIVWMGENERVCGLGDMIEVGGLSAGREGMLAVGIRKG